MKIENHFKKEKTYQNIVQKFGGFFVIKKKLKVCLIFICWILIKEQFYFP